MLKAKGMRAMKLHAAFRRRSHSQVVARANEDRHPAEIVPYGRFGAGVWTGHPMGLAIVLGMLFLEAIAIPWFLAAQVVLGAVVAFFLWRCHQPK
jgi:hypothetical protein